MTSDSQPLDPSPTLRQKLNVDFALQATGLGIWELDPISRTIHWDERCQALFGIRAGSYIPYQQAIRYIHPEDVDRVDQAVQRALDPQSDGIYDQTYRTIGMDDGQLRWVRFQGRAYFAQQRQLLRFGGVAQEVTQQHQQQQALEQARQRFQIAFDHALLGMVITDAQGRLQQSNLAYSRITGYSADQLRHFAYDQLTHPDDLATNRQLIAQLVSGQIPAFELEKRYLRQDGAEIWVRMSVTRTTDGAGHTQNLVGICQDITQERTAAQQRQHAQAQLATSEARFRNIVEQALSPICLLKGEELVLEIGNPPLLEVWNAGPEALGQPLLTILPEMRDQPIVGWLLEVYRQGVTHRLREIPAYFIRKNGQREDRHFDFIYQLEVLVEQLKRDGVTVVDEITVYEQGKFVHILDPEGNKIELWEEIN